MTDNYDPFVEAEVEDRLLRKSREDAREKLQAAFRLEVGFDAALHAQTLQRDMRWWHGLWTRTYASRIG